MYWHVLSPHLILLEHVPFLSHLTQSASKPLTGMSGETAAFVKTRPYLLPFAKDPLHAGGFACALYAGLVKWKGFQIVHTIALLFNDCNISFFFTATRR